MLQEGMQQNGEGVPGGDLSLRQLRAKLEERRPVEDTDRGPELDGDILTEFERLAAWMTAKGVSDVDVMRYGNWIVSGKANERLAESFVRSVLEDRPDLVPQLGGLIDKVQSLIREPRPRLLGLEKSA